MVVGNQRYSTAGAVKVFTGRVNVFIFRALGRCIYLRI